MLSSRIQVALSPAILVRWPLMHKAAQSSRRAVMSCCQICAGWCISITTRWYPPILVYGLKLAGTLFQHHSSCPSTTVVHPSFGLQNSRRQSVYATTPVVSPIHSISPATYTRGFAVRSMGLCLRHWSMRYFLVLYNPSRVGHLILVPEAHLNSYADCCCRLWCLCWRWVGEGIGCDTKHSQLFWTAAQSARCCLDVGCGGCTSRLHCYSFNLFATC